MCTNGERKGTFYKKYKEFLLSQWQEEPCIYYDLHIERLESSGRNRRWCTVKRDTKFIPFYLEDDTGEILVDFTDADFKLRKDHVIENGTFSRLSPRMKEFLEKHKVSYKSIVRTQMKMRISEDYIGFGESLYVLGSAEINDRHKNDQQPDKDKGPTAVLRKSRPARLLTSRATPTGSRWMKQSSL